MKTLQDKVSPAGTLAASPFLSSHLISSHIVTIVRGTVLRHIQEHSKPDAPNPLAKHDMYISRKDQPKLGFVPRGTGGGACIPEGFFGGGGGGGLLLMFAGVGLVTVAGTSAWGCSGTGDACFSKKLFTRPVTLNFLFHPFAFWAPAEI